MGRSKARRKYRTLGYRYVAKECMCWSEEVEVVKVREGDLSLSLRGEGRNRGGEMKRAMKREKESFAPFFQRPLLLFLFSRPLGGERKARSVMGRQDS